MSHFEYFRKPDSIPCNPDRPPPIVIKMKSLSLESIKQFPLFLIENLDLIHNNEGIDTHLEARPVEVELEGGAIINERVIWELVIQCVPNAVTLIEKYIDALLARLEEGDDLGFCSYVDVVGQEALYAYLNSYDDEKYNLEDYLVIVDCFFRYYKRCDIDHFYSPDSYLMDMLDNSDLTNDRFTDLLYYYMFNSQFGFDDYVRNRKYLIKDGVLKLFVDLRIKERALDGWWGMLEILQLCAPVYGNKTELTADVLKYCKEKYNNFGCKNDDLQNFQPKLINVRAKCDADRVNHVASKYASLNTGFHKYDGEQKSWTLL